MTKADIVARINEKTGFSMRESADLLELLFSIMKDTLAAGENIKVSGFGNFEVRHKADRLGRNPQTGETMTIEARRILAFKSSVLLKQAINEE